MNVTLPSFCRHKLALALAALLFMGLAASPATAQRVRIETTVKDFVTTSFMVGCPSYGRDSAFVMDLMKTEMTNEEATTLLDLLGDFEEEHGLTINSRTHTIDFTTAFDNIRTISRGPLAGEGKALCDFLKTLQK